MQIMQDVITAPNTVARVACNIMHTLHREPARFVCLALLHVTCALEGSSSYKQLAFSVGRLGMCGMNVACK